MKILDRYIFFSFIKTFGAVFTILLFIFVLQGVWLHINELAGKDLDAIIIGKFLFYLIPIFVPMVLLLTILVSSIMTFGSFSENYEFAAMKSSGISLQRAMRGLIFFIAILSVTAFFFANNVIPWAEFKSINLRKNISKLKPAMAIVEGAFTDIGNMNIKVEEKTGDNDQFLHDVIIHITEETSAENHTVIKAERGELVGSKDSDILSLILFNGNYYDELQPKDYKERRRKPYVKSEFQEYTYNIDLSGFNDVDFEDERYNYSYKMLDISELRVALDSLSKDLNTDKRNFYKNLISRSGIANMGDYVRKKDSLEETKQIRLRGKKSIVKDTVTYDIAGVDDFFESYNSMQQQQITNIALGTVRGTLSNINGKTDNFKRKASRLNKTEIQLHDKYALAVACFILFFVGAPLGAIIRKGGLGLPMVVAVLLFLSYHFIGIFAKNSAENGSISPFVATWLSTFIMFPLSVFLTYRATTDQGFFKLDVIVEPLKKFIKKIGLVKRETSEQPESLEDITKQINLSKEDLVLLDSYANEKLIDIVQNYQQYGYSNDYRIGALQILDKRGMTQEELQKTGQLHNKKQQRLRFLVNELKLSLNRTTITYCILLVLPIIIAVVAHQVGGDTKTIYTVGIIVTAITVILFYIFLFRNESIHQEINKLTKDNRKSGLYFLLILGIVFYLLLYLNYRKELKKISVQ